MIKFCYTQVVPGVTTLALLNESNVPLVPKENKYQAIATNVDDEGWTVFTYDSKSEDITDETRFIYLHDEMDYALLDAIAGGS